MNSTTNHSAAVNSSGGYLVDDPDLQQPGDLAILMELNLILLTCLITIIPLVLLLLSVLALRRFWRKWRRQRVERALGRSGSDEPAKSSHLLLPDEIKTSESQFSVIPVEEMDEVMTTYISAPSGNAGNLNHTSMSTANGSIITMTMKNNHLIVETETRVQEEEVGVPEPHRAGEEDSTALIHREEEAAPRGHIQGPSSNTGLSQSDLSLSSGASGNPGHGYSYGNQTEYLGDERSLRTQAHSSTAIRLKHAPFVVQPSQDVEDDDLYLEQQHQLGNGLDDLQTPAATLCTPYENPAFVATPDQPQVNPTS